MDVGIVGVGRRFLIEETMIGRRGDVVVGEVGVRVILMSILDRRRGGHNRRGDEVMI